MRPTDRSSPELDQAHYELLEGLERLVRSREIVRQSRFLIELSESDGACAETRNDTAA